MPKVAALIAVGSLALLALAGRAPRPPLAAAAQDVTAPPEFVYVHITAVRDDMLLVTQTTPPPDSLFAIRVPGPKLTIGATLTCTKAESSFTCDQGILEYIGCHSPIPIPATPFLKASF